MNIAGGCGLPVISRQSGRRVMDVQSMCPILSARPQDGSSSPRSRSQISLHNQLSIGSLHSKPTKQFIQEKGTMHGGISHNLLIRSRLQSKSLKSHIQIAAASLSLIGPEHMRALQKMHSMLTTWMWTQEANRESCTMPKFHSTTPIQHLAKKTHTGNFSRCHSPMTTMIQSSGGNQREWELSCKSGSLSGINIQLYATNAAQR